MYACVYVREFCERVVGCARRADEKALLLMLIHDSSSRVLYEVRWLVDGSIERSSVGKTDWTESLPFPTRYTKPNPS